VKRERSGAVSRPAARGGADEREARDREPHAAGVGPLVDHDVEPEVLHRRVEVFLDGLRDAVDLVDEQDVALLEVGEQAGEVAGLLDDGAGGDAHVAAELVAEDEGEGGLAEAGRAGEQDVVERLAAALGGADHDLQALDGLELAGEIGERQRPQRRLGRRDRRGEAWVMKPRPFAGGAAFSILDFRFWIGSRGKNVGRRQMRWRRNRNRKSKSKIEN
jgi:hypothetical protein